MTISNVIQVGNVFNVSFFFFFLMLGMKMLFIICVNRIRLKNNKLPLVVCNKKNKVKKNLFRFFNLTRFFSSDNKSNKFNKFNVIVFFSVSFLFRFHSIFTSLILSL